MSAAHTPAPWEMRDGSLHRRHWLVDAPGRRFVAQIDGPPDEEGEANARLISAAPYLLDAAELALSTLRTINPADRTVEDQQAITALISAVDRATGASA